MNFYNFKQANDIVSQYMEKEDDYNSIDKLIPVWIKLANQLWRMEGFIFDFSLDGDGCWDFTLRSNWSGQGLGGYADGFEYDCSHMDDDIEDLSPQQRALITTAKIIAYEINNDYKTDLIKEIQYTGVSKSFISANKNISYSDFKSLAKKDPKTLIDLIRENQLPSHLMQYSLSCVSYLDNKPAFLLNKIKELSHHRLSRVRLGAYSALASYKEQKVLEDCLKIEPNFYNKSSIRNAIKRLKENR